MLDVTANEMAKAKVGFAIHLINLDLVADVMLTGPSFAISRIRAAALRH